MGHYDTSYQHDDSNRLTEKQVIAQRVKNNLNAMHLNMNGIKVPPRFTGMLEDFDNWLKQTYKVK